MVGHDYQTPLAEVAGTLHAEVGATHFRRVGIDHHVALLKEMRGKLMGRLEITAAVVLKVDDKILHPLGAEVREGFLKFLFGLLAEARDADVAGSRVGHIGGVDAVDRDVVARHEEGYRLGRALAEHFKKYLRTLFAAQNLDDARVGELASGNHRIAGLDDAVAGEDADFLRRAAGSGLNHE